MQKTGHILFFISYIVFMLVFFITKGLFNAIKDYCLGVGEMFEWLFKYE